MRYGNEKYRYELVPGWAKLPEDMTFLDVCGVCVAEDGSIYAINRGEYPIAVFDPSGELVARWGQGLFNRIHSACLGTDNTIICVDAEDHSISTFTRDGKKLSQLGVSGHPSDTGFVRQKNLDLSLDGMTRSAGPFNSPTGVCLDAEGNLLVADGYGNARIHTFSPTGELLTSYGDIGRGIGQFRVPHAVRADKYGHIWVADRQNDRLQLFDKDFNFICQWTGFNRPCDLCFNDEDAVFVAELCGRVSICSALGESLSEIDGSLTDESGSRLFIAAHCLALDSEGSLFVGDVANTMGHVDRRGSALQKFVRIT